MTWWEAALCGFGGALGAELGVWGRRAIARAQRKRQLNGSDR